jgi:UPF0148 protein
MPVRKEDEIMAEYLLKGGKMLEKACRTCGCPLFEVKGKTLCVVCAENEVSDKDKKDTKKGKKAAAVPEKAEAAAPVHDNGTACICEEEPGDDSFSGDEGEMLAEELAMTIHALCERVRNEKDPADVLTLMNSIKAGCEALGILCRV